MSPWESPERKISLNNVNSDFYSQTRSAKKVEYNTDINLNLDISNPHSNGNNGNGILRKNINNNNQGYNKDKRKHNYYPNNNDLYN